MSRWLKRTHTAMRMDTAFPSKFLKAADVDERADETTETWTVKMADVEMEEVGDSEKPILHFQGLDKGLVLNKTNANTIMTLYGKETDTWAGKAIGLFTTEVEYQGKQTLGIRIRAKAPKATKAPMPAVDEDEIPF